MSVDVFMHLAAKRNWIIFYYCASHQGDNKEITGCFHYWNDQRGWVDDKLEATEYTRGEMNAKRLHLEKVMSTTCRTMLMQADQCDTRIGQEVIHDEAVQA